MVAGLRTSFRVGLISAVLLATGCVSNSQSGLYGGNFDHEDAARTRTSLGLTYLQNNNYTQAKKNLDKALEFNPRSADVQFAMAYYYQLVGDNRRAEEFYQTSIDLAPDNGDIANSYGAFKCQNGQYDEARQYFFKAINNRLYANAAQTYENLALCAQSQGELDDAIGYLQEALNHQPARGKTLFLLSELYTASEQWDLAESSLRKYERVARVSPDYLWLAHEVAKGKGDVLAAREYGDMMVSVYPESELTQRYLKERETHQNKVVRTVKSVEAAPTEGQVVSAEADDTVAEEKNAAQTAKTELAKSDNDSTQQNSAPRDAEANETITDAQGNDTKQKIELSAQSNKFHVVKEGENLYRISLLHNIRMATLQKWNNLENTGAIIAGQRLWLVPPNMQEE